MILSQQCLWIKRRSHDTIDLPVALKCRKNAKNIKLENTTLTLSAFSKSAFFWHCVSFSVIAIILLRLFSDLKTQTQSKMQPECLLQEWPKAPLTVRVAQNKILKQLLF